MGLANTWQCLPKRLWARGQKITFLFLWRSDSIFTGRGFSSHFSSKFWDLDLNLVINGHFSGARSPDSPGLSGWNTISVTSNSTWINSQRFWKVKFKSFAGSIGLSGFCLVLYKSRNDLIVYYGSGPFLICLDGIFLLLKRFRLWRTMLLEFSFRLCPQRTITWL